MILGRNTQQWMGLVTSIIGFAGLVIGVAFPGLLGPATIILNGLTGVLGVVILFIANVYTTPTNDPKLVAGTMVQITDATGRTVAHAPVPSPEDLANVTALAEGIQEDDPADLTEDAMGDDHA